MTNIRKIKPEELANLTIYYSFAESRFGIIVVASTAKGICFLGFTDTENIIPEDLQCRFTKAKFIQKEDEFQKSAILALAENNPKNVKFHLKCTDFQLEVWQELLKTRAGCLTTYGTIAQKINRPRAIRAVGRAVGSNPVAVLIPCHRVVLHSGEWGNYYWGKERKAEIINFEKQ